MIQGPSYCRQERNVPKLGYVPKQHTAREAIQMLKHTLRPRASWKKKTPWELTKVIKKP